LQKNISSRKDAKVPGTSKQFATEDTEGINGSTIKDQGVRVLERQGNLFRKSGLLSVLNSSLELIKARSSTLTP
jgi:hypothetical protein